MGSFEILGRWLVVLGIVIAIVGGLLWLGSRLLGTHELPGTLRINIPGGTCLIPILASIVLSIVLTVVLNLVIRLINR